MAAPVITIMGIIGSGKTVQAERLAKRLGWQTFSTGQLIRDSDNHVAKQAHDQGVLAPTEFIQEMILDKIRSFDGDTGIIMDGSPRMLPEAERYDIELPKMGRKLDLVIVLEVERDEVESRLKDRGRIDDTPHAIAARFKTFEQEIRPVINRYRERGIVHEVDGIGSLDEVTDRIVEVLKREDLV